MKLSRVWFIWVVLGVCALTVFGAMAWLTRSTINESNMRAAADARADLEERTRLALWRMDALGSAIVLRENQHSVAHYQSSMRSPFLTLDYPEVMLHFQVVQGGGLTSPENDRLNGLEAGVQSDLLVERTKRMEQLRALLEANPLPGDEWAQLSCAADQGEVSWQAVPKSAEPSLELQLKQKDDAFGGNDAVASKRRDAQYQTYNSVNEYAQRAKAVEKNLEAQQEFPNQAAADYDKQSMLSQRQELDGAIHDSAEEDAGLAAVSAKPFRGAWLGDEMFLLRKVTRGEADGNQSKPNQVVQGVWMNTGALKKQLLGEVSDLLPKASLVPASGAQMASNPMALVSFPFVLSRNEVIAVSSGGGLSDPLKAGWVAVVVAVLAAVLLVHGIMRLSERRASFVSAVTHELRTPLTTFRLYSDMLESGAVREDKRSHYLNVLTREADRLSHLVENVLAFSRIERGNARSQVKEATLVELVESSRERLEARLEAAGMELKVHELPALLCKVDTTAVEHILFNLIDNAAKYAEGSDPSLVELRAKRCGSRVEISVCDHGRGISAKERSRVFQPFHKSAHEAAETKPGVGLGLALSRRLAKSMGGDLRCDARERGACFILSLPLSAGQ